MAWNSQGGGGGPWGGGGGQGGPWGRGSGGGGGGSGGQPPDLEELLRKSQEKFRKAMPKGVGGGRGIGVLVIAALVLWGLTGFYKVNQDEIGVVLRFGRFVGLTQPGLNYHLPSPIETVLTPPFTRINKTEVGFRNPEGRPIARDTKDESLMLTGDENIVDINFSVFWRINDPEKYLFDVRDPDGTVKVVAESSMREIIGQMPIRAPLFENREQIAERARARIQELLDEYGAGVSVTQVQFLKADVPPDVVDSFIDVQRAKADQERLGNEAESYRNDIIPRARGDAQRLIQEAEAYKEQVTNIAQGDAQRFISVYQAYRTAPDVTSRRLYIETMESVLKNAQKVVIDPSARSVVPYLPLPGLARPPAGQPQPAGQGGK